VVVTSLDWDVGGDDGSEALPAARSDDPA